MSKHKFNIHYRGSPRGSRTQQEAYCLRCAHFQHIEAHLGKKQPQVKIPIAFLFIRLHFKVARYSFSGPIPPKFEHKLRRHKKSFGKIATTVVLHKDENLL